MRSKAGRLHSAFTLMELLVVISIIVILLGILLPVIGNMRKQAKATDTRAQIAQLDGLIRNYFNDFNAYPGPIPNTQLRVPTASSLNHLPPAIGDKVTMAENLYLGLMGGIENTAAAGATPVIVFSAGKAGQGPRALSGSKKKYSPYGQNSDFTKSGPLGKAGDFIDDVDDCDDTEIPEFVDRFTDPLPLLYLRARVGAKPTAAMLAMMPPDGGIVSEAPSANHQYDRTQVTPYTGPGKGGHHIGIGKENDGDWYNVTFPNQGFNNMIDLSATLARPEMSTTWTYPYNLHAVLRHPTLTSNINAAPTARQQDGYILISAGTDRVYGTRDDITNFGNY